MPSIRKTFIAGTSIVTTLLFVAGCSSSGGGGGSIDSELATKSMECAGEAYDTVLYNQYDSGFSVSDRSVVAVALRNEAEGMGEVSPGSRRRLLNVVSAQQADGIIDEYFDCLP